MALVGSVFANCEGSSLRPGAQRKNASLPCSSLRRIAAPPPSVPPQGATRSRRCSIGFEKADHFSKRYRSRSSSRSRARSKARFARYHSTLARRCASSPCSRSRPAFSCWRSVISRPGVLLSFVFSCPSPSNSCALWTSSRSDSACCRCASICCSGVACKTPSARSDEDSWRSGCPATCCLGASAWSSYSCASRCTRAWLNCCSAACSFGSCSCMCTARAADRWICAACSR
jgi:hypothetical protein